MVYEAGVLLHWLHVSRFWHRVEEFAFSWFSKVFKAVGFSSSGEAKYLTSFIDKVGGYTGLFRVVYRDGILTLLTTRLTANILVRYTVLCISFWYVPLDRPPDANWHYSNQCYRLLTWSLWTYGFKLFPVRKVLTASGQISGRIFSPVKPVCSSCWAPVYSSLILPPLLQLNKSGSRHTYLPTLTSTPRRSVKAPCPQNRIADIPGHFSSSDIDHVHLSDRCILELDPSVGHSLSAEWNNLTIAIMVSCTFISRLSWVSNIWLE